MTPEQINQMAYQSGLLPNLEVYDEDVQAFANLVRNSTLEEAAAKFDKEADQVTALRPATVLEMVSMISKQREVMRQALEALHCSELDDKRFEAIDALEEALK
jgi:hypothetical protein